MKLCALVLGLTIFVISPGGHAAVGEEDPWALQWSQTRTASVRVYYEVGSPIPSARLRELELAVQRLADELQLDDTARASLRERPIQYLYVRSALSLQWFGVDDVDGMAFSAERRILAARIPHEHELVHVLAHIAIAPDAAHNQPWLQEGLASYFGGHLSESPIAVLATGDDALDRYPGLIARLLTASGFRQSAIPATETYSSAARFLHYLDEERGGLDPILELGRLLAGEQEEVVQRPASIIETQLEGVYDTNFAELLDDFEVWRAANPVAGVEIVRPPRRAADFVFSDSDHLVRWWVDESGWVIAVTPRQKRIDLALVWGNASPASGAWTAPSSSGYELRFDENGGHLVDDRRKTVSLRWFDRSAERGEGGEVAWFFPAEALGSVASPESAREVILWSQPRFEVE